MEHIFILLLLFQFKHFLADYPLQSSYMLGKFKPNAFNDGWVLPLLAHAGVHALMTLVICLVVRPNLWWLSLVDMSIHFVMDRIKASPNLLGRFETNNKYFWWALGLDQGMHHITHYLIIYFLLI